ncbi:MAG TPA: Ger(x)C family spore germination C-terminal domain-containing protein, partial [Bacillales bacterium]|nr:Ger(x)C family spore germination C-terminal domain-containing protein [Bacillales bacterium]
QTDFRPNITVLVAKGPAQKLVQTVPIMNTTIGLELRNLTESNRFDETNMVQDISKFTEQLLANTADPYTGVIQTASEAGVDIGKSKTARKKNDDRRNKEKKSKKPKSSKPKMLGLSGTAVFKKGRLKGYLNERETQGLLAIKGDLTSGIVVLDCGGNRKGTVSLTIKGTESQYIPKLGGETPEMVVKMRVNAEIGDITCPDFNISPASIDRLNGKLADYMKHSATAVLNQAKNEWQTDIFSFGSSIYKKDPDTWKDLESHWRDGKLKQMDVHLKISANILRHGLFKDPGQTDEAR